VKRFVFAAAVLWHAAFAAGAISTAPAGWNVWAVEAFLAQPISLNLGLRRIPTTPREAGEPAAQA